MHEASIALSILGIAEEQCRRAGCTRIESISVDIGRASGVLPEALLTAFDLAKLDTPASGARLLINEIPLGGRCEECGKEFETADLFILECPLCRGARFRMQKGRELDVTQIEAQ